MSFQLVSNQMPARTDKKNGWKRHGIHLLFLSFSDPFLSLLRLSTDYGTKTTFSVPRVRAV